MTSKPWLNFYDEGVTHTLDIPDLTVPQFLQKAATEYPHHTASVFMGARLSFAD